MFSFKMGEQSELIKINEIPLVRKETMLHIVTPEACVSQHGFFDVEQKKCTTIHRLAKVCLKVDQSEDD